MMAVDAQKLKFGQIVECRIGGGNRAMIYVRHQTVMRVEVTDGAGNFHSVATVDVICVIGSIDLSAYNTLAGKCEPGKEKKE